MTDHSLLDQLVPNAGVYLQLARFGLVLVVGLVATRVAVVPVLSWVLRRRDARKETRYSIVNLGAIVGYFVTFTVALQAGEFGNLVTIIGAVAAALTVAIGFGMRDQISNVVAGFLIYLYNPFFVGDYIESGDAEGVVEEISLATTTLAGSASQTVVVPNGQLLTEGLKNYTRDARTKASIRIGLPEAHLEAGMALLEEVATDHDEVLAEPSHDVFYGEDDGEVYAELHYWLADSRRSKQVKSQVLAAFHAQAVDRGLYVDTEGEDVD